MKKIGTVYGLLVILIIVALLVRFWQGRNLQNSVSRNITNTKNIQPPNPKSFVGKLSLRSSAATYKVGDAIDVEVVFEAPGKTLDGADIVLRFNPSVINALGFTPAAYFNMTPRKDVDNTAGTVKITSLDAASAVPASGQVSLGVVHFQAQKEGTTQLSFDFTEGVSNKTALTEHGTSQNILGEAKGTALTVTP